MKVRKHPFFIHVDPNQAVVLNMNGRYCPHCDLLILHQDKVEELLAAALALQDPELIGNAYLIVGTVERKGWRQVQKEPYNLQAVFDNLHDFEEVVDFKPAHYGWG